MRTVRSLFESSAHGFDCHCLGLRGVFHYLGQRPAIGRNRIELREHRLSGFLQDNFHGAVVDNSHAHCVRVSRLGNLWSVPSALICWPVGPYIPLASKSTTGFWGSCVSAESIIQVPSKGLGVVAPDCKKSRKARSVFIRNRLVEGAWRILRQGLSDG